MVSKQEVFCVFEGGGAKGVAHVGFLTALDEHPGYHVRGYAGTSAGAVVAALAAAGWTGSELFSEVDGDRRSAAISYLNSECGESISSLADFIEKDEWRILSFLRKHLNAANAASGQQQTGDIGAYVRTYAIGYLIVLLLLLALAIVASFLGGWIAWVLLALFALALALPTCLALGYFSGKYRGFASMERPERLLEELLKKKISKDNDEPTTFEDVFRATGFALKIIASDLESGTIKMFSLDTTPDVSVAKAVTASACIPLFFKPVEIEVDGQTRQFCDGGIVSNLPAWAFDGERLIDGDCLTVTCEVSPPNAQKISRPGLRGLRLLTRVAVTSVFGSAGLNTRGMLRHIPLSAWASFNLLDFDLVEEQVNLIQSSKEQADIKMDLERNHRLSIDGMFSELRGLMGESGLAEDSVRVSYARYIQLVDGPPAAFHLWNCRGFDGYADAGIALPAVDSLLGDAMKVGEPRFYNLEDESIKEWYLSVGNGSLEGRVAKDRKWVLIVPTTELRRHGRVSVAVCVDGGEMPGDDLDTFSSEVNAIVTKFA